VHLYAQSSVADTPVSERKEKAVAIIAKVLEELGVANIDEAKLYARFEQIDVLAGDRERIASAITGFLEEDVALAKEEARKVIEGGMAMLDQLLAAMATTTSANGHADTSNGAKETDTGLSNNGPHPVYIDDVWAWKAGMQVSKGARPVKDLSEFEDIEAKL
jgi:insulysin